jgi:pyruvate formate lyase activating enzyme
MARRPRGGVDERLHVALPLLAGLTDDFGDIERVANFAAGLGNVERVDVLPFHQLGRYKWHQLGIPCTLERVSPPEIDLVERACGVFRTEGLVAH